MLLGRHTASLTTIVITLWLLSQHMHLPATALPTIEVNAGPLTRTNAIVQFTLPSSVRGDPLQLRDLANQSTVPLQIAVDRTAWFVLPSLAGNATRRFAIEPALDRRETSWPAEAVETLDAVLLRSRQQRVARFQIERPHVPYGDANASMQRAAYLHPLYTPSGRIVTDASPSSAPEHHGIWTSWARTQFQRRNPDFWNMTARTGRVEFEALLNTWSGPVHAGLRSRHRLVDLSLSLPITALIEVWDVRMYALDARQPIPFRMLDVTSIQEPATTDPVTLLEQTYGGFAVRGPSAWSQESQQPLFLSSEHTSRDAADGTRVRWCYLGGLVDGRLAGIAILSDPRNLHAPQPLRIHTADPFFCFTPTRLGRIDLLPGQTLVTRMRILTIDGPPDEAWLEQKWQELASPVTVRF